MSGENSLRPISPQSTTQNLNWNVQKEAGVATAKLDMYISSGVKKTITVTINAEPGQLDKLIKEMGREVLESFASAYGVGVKSKSVELQMLDNSTKAETKKIVAKSIDNSGGELVENYDEIEDRKQAAINGIREVFFSNHPVERSTTLERSANSRASVGFNADDVDPTETLNQLYSPTRQYVKENEGDETPPVDAARERRLSQEKRPVLDEHNSDDALA